MPERKLYCGRNTPCTNSLPLLKRKEFYFPKTSYQNSFKRHLNLLFVCDLGLNRSRTAADFFSENYNADYMGIYSPFISNSDIENKLNWADLVFVMEETHETTIKDRFSRIYEEKGDKIFNLNIPDIYLRNQGDLKEILQEKINKVLLNYEKNRKNPLELEREAYFSNINSYNTQKKNWRSVDFYDKNKMYGTHAWIAEIALDIVLEFDKQLGSNSKWGSFWRSAERRKLYLYGTAGPDIGDVQCTDLNGNILKGKSIGAYHTAFFYANGKIEDLEKNAVKMASEWGEEAKSYYLNKDYNSAAFCMGVMTHYLADCASFVHVYSCIEETIHEDFENEISYRTDSRKGINEDSAFKPYSEKEEDRYEFFSIDKKSIIEELKKIENIEYKDQSIENFAREIVIDTQYDSSDPENPGDSTAEFVCKNYGMLEREWNSLDTG